MNDNLLSDQYLIEQVASSLSLKWANDKPAIRTAIDDTIDSLQRDGFKFNWDGMGKAEMVEAVRELIVNKAIANARA